MIIMDKTIPDSWIADLVKDFNRAYLNFPHEAAPYGDIDMMSDHDYEDIVVGMVIDSWQNELVQLGAVNFYDLDGSVQELAVKLVMTHLDCDGGMYKGKLPHASTIRAALKRA
jgi:hypothetical protein